MLVLRDGTTVTDVEALRGAVADDSATAAAIDRVADLTWKRDAAIAASVTLLGLGVVAPVVASSSNEPEVALTATVAGLGSMAVGLGVFALAEHLMLETWQQKAAAMITFGPDAAARLGVPAAPATTSPTESAAPPPTLLSPQTAEE